MIIASLVLTIKQVAECLQVSTDTVYQLATSGVLQGRNIGRIWRFPKDAIERFVQQSTVAAVGGGRIA